MRRDCSREYGIVDRGFAGRTVAAWHTDSNTAIRGLSLDSKDMLVTIRRKLAPRH